VNDDGIPWSDTTARGMSESQPATSGDKILVSLWLISSFRPRQVPSHYLSHPRIGRSITQLKSNESKYRGSGHACSLTEAMGVDVRLATASALDGGISIGAEVDRESERTNQHNLRNSTVEDGLANILRRGFP
jgi:hypothetical protein